MGLLHAEWQVPMPAVDSLNSCEAELSASVVAVEMGRKTMKQTACHAHNLPTGRFEQPSTWGARLRPKVGDTLLPITGDWVSVRWYGSKRERDRAIEDILSEHLYSRRGDRPWVACDPIGPDSIGDRPSETH